MFVDQSADTCVEPETVRGAKFRPPPAKKRASTGFDPYHKWLGIPPEEQPPNHYRLLGLPPFEADLDVIDAAAKARSGRRAERANAPPDERVRRTEFRRHFMNGQTRDAGGE